MDGGQTDAGQPDAGQTDAGTPDGGQTDGGEVASEPAIVEPVTTVDGWKLFDFTRADGTPVTLNGVTADEGGNIWVAGGTDGLFLLRKGSTQWEQFTLKDGLHPYGYYPDGGELPGPYYLEVLSVAGGPSGTVFVGYRGRPAPGTEPDDDSCQQNWDMGSKDPNIYQSGDADRVTLKGGPGDGISVVHYDIFSGPGMVAGEPAGRERLCSIYRILYDGPSHSLWFGANHGFAWGDPTFPGAAANHCVGKKFGALSCSGVKEHIHPGLSSSDGALLTYRYYGLAQGAAGLWVGGWARSVHFNFGNQGDNFWTYEGEQFDPSSWIDVWPDAVPNYVTMQQFNQGLDAIMGVAALPGGGAWFASKVKGAARLDAGGAVTKYLSTRNGLMEDRLTAVATDPKGNGVWFGYAEMGVSHYETNGTFQNFGATTFGYDQASHTVTDLYNDDHAVLMTFENGVLGIYPE